MRRTAAVTVRGTASTDGRAVAADGDPPNGTSTGARATGAGSDGGAGAGR